MNDHYTRDYNPPSGSRVASSDLINEFQAIENGFDSVQSGVEDTLRQESGTAIAALPNSVSRALKVLSFDAYGNPRTTIAETDLAAAVTAASSAATNAGIATTQAGTATAQAGIATTQAGIATTQAGIATTKAAEAAASAASIAGSVTSVNGRAGAVTGIAEDGGVFVISTNTTAVRYRTYVMTASLTLTLPASPTAGDWVAIVNRSGTTTPVIGRNSQSIMGLAEDMTLDNANATLTLTFADSTRGWIWN